jgi:hypothetical protein
MSGVIATIPKYQFSAADGTPLASGTLTTYLAGTTTLSNTWQDSALTSANTNPIVLDSRGECVLWLDGTKAYKFVLKNAAGVTQWTVDNITPNGDASLVSYQPAGLGAVATTVQAKLRERASVTDFGAVSGVDCAAAVAAGTAAARELIFPAGTWTAVSTPTITGNSVMHSIPGAVVTGNMYNLGFTLGAQYQTIQNNTSSSDFATGYFRRNVNHVGGTPGSVSSCLRAETYVTTASTNFEWAFTSVMDNSAVAGENVGGYFLGRKRSTGPTWGAVVEVLEVTPTNDPATGTVALEVDVSCNGTDAFAPYGSRVGVDLAIRKYVAGGATANVGWGFRIQNGGDTTSLVDRGYSFFPGMICNKAFDASTATCVTAAFQMETNQVFSFNSSATRQMTHSGSGWIFKNNAGTTYWALNDDRSLVVQGVQMLGGRQTGWTAMTGAADNASAFAVGTVTLSQLASRVNALQVALTTHGLIGV